MTRAPQLRSMRSRVAGMLPPGSPATISTRTCCRPAAGRAAPARRPPPAAARRSACSRSTVAPTASIIASRSWLDMPPPGTQCRPIWQPASKPAQKPRNGPNENGKNTRSPGPTRAAAVDRLPALEHPLPALVGVDPPQRPAGRGRRLAVAGVAFDRLGQRGAPGRVRVLVGDELRLRRERQPRQIARKLQRRRSRRRPRRACACRRHCGPWMAASSADRRRPCAREPAHPDRDVRDPLRGLPAAANRRRCGATALGVRRVVRRRRHCQCDVRPS